eukprot:4088525-Pyramimonas_sp.AAC.1
MAQPLIIYGNASGRSDTHDPRLRRVGLAAAAFSPESNEDFPVLFGPLPGDRQTVARGELYMMEVSIRWSSGPTVYVTDNDEVCRGWWARAYDQPTGPNTDIWRAIQKHLEVRACSDIVVLKVASHLDGRQAIEQQVPPWM